MSFPTPLSRPLGALALAAFGALPAALDAQPAEVYFVHRSQTVVEHQTTVEVAIEISRSTSVPVKIPFRLGAASTATLRTTATGPGDFYIAEDSDPDDGNNMLWNPATGVGEITLPARARQRSITLTLNNDYEAEETETIILEIITDEVTVARAVLPHTHTIYIQDNDSPEDGTPWSTDLYLERTHFRVTEGGTVNIPVRLHRRASEPLELTWNYVFETGANRANLGDVVVGTDENGEAVKVLSIASNADQAVITFQIRADAEVEETEFLFVELGELRVREDSTTSPKPVFTIDSRRITVEILDDDPTTVYMDFSQDFESNWAGRSIREGEFYQIPVRLSSPLSENVTIPVTFGGTAVKGTDSDTQGKDYRILPQNENNVLTIEAGDTATTLSIITLNDTLVEPEKTIVVTLGTPTLARGGTLGFGTEDGQVSTYTFTLEDNDPVDFGFGVLNPALSNADLSDEERAALDPYVPADRFIVAESDGSVTIPIYLSGFAPEATRFEVEVVSSGTTAKMADFNSNDPNQDFDFFVNLGGTGVIREMDKPTATGLNASSFVYSLTVNLNPRTRPALPFSLLDAYLGGEPLPEEFASLRGDRDVRLRLVRITNSADSGVSLRSGSTEFTVTIKEVPDIDLTALFSGTSPATDNWVDGAPPRNPRTGLHELRYDLALSEANEALLRGYVGSPDNDYADARLRGYTAYRIAFQPGIYDPANPDSPNNDPLLPSRTPDGVTPFTYTVNTPYKPRFQAGIRQVVIREGAEQVRPNVFNPENADILMEEYFLVQPLNFAQLDPNRGSPREGVFDLGEAMDFLVEFSNRGRYAFDLDRVDRSLDPQAMRVILSRTSLPSNARSSFNGSILNFEEADDGRFVLEFSNPNGTAYQIEYLDPDGVWKLAHPGLISGSASTLIWEDTGPPKTFPHPREVDFRLYRIRNQ
jgi:hypothetical protein